MLRTFAPLLLAAFLFPVRARAEQPTVALEARVPVDGAELYLEARGDDRSAPVILWLHGGPGGAERPLFRYFNGGLESHFVAVYLDQRGAGRSFDDAADPKRLTIAQHLADLDRVVDWLRNALGAERVTLIGHSWGGALGFLYAQAHPEKVTALVAVAPLVDTLAAQREQFEFVESEAKQRGDESVLEKLREIGAPPHATAEKALAVERLAGDYGAVFHRKPSFAWTMLRGIAGGLVTPWELPSMFRGNDVSLAAMNDELLGLDLARSVPSLEVPVIAILGRFDHHVSAAVAARYVETLRAPAKKVIWFEESAHNPPFEEPERFDATLVGELGALAAK